MSESLSAEQRVAIFAEKAQAFRSTLDEPEQDLLDQLLAGAVVEVDVESHQFSLKKAAFKAANAANATDMLAAAAAKEGDDIEDVSAHAQTQGVITPLFKFKADQGVIAAVPLDRHSQI